MKKRLLIVESYLRTRSWIVASESLSNVELFVVNLMQSEKEFLNETSVKKDNILDLSEIDFKGASQSQIDSLLKAEKFFNLNINSIVGLDRILSKKTNFEALSYLAIIYEKISCFLSQNNIDMVLLEPTWAHEILLCEIANINKIEAFFMHTARLPYERFLFFKGYAQSDFYRRKIKNVPPSLSEKVYNKIVLENKKPDYFYLNNKKNRFSLDWIYSFLKRIKNHKPDNPYLTPKFLELIISKLMKWARLKKLSNKNLFVSLGHIKKPYVLISLHVQPEASIDVLAPKFANQIENIRQISRTTPSTHYVLVKEHSNALGDRSIAFYEELIGIPGIVLLDPNEDSHRAIKKASLVISPTGTISYEAALLGIRSVTMVRMFFSELLIQEVFDPFQDKVSDLLNVAPKKKKVILKDLNAILSNTFLGDTTDIKSNPKVLKKENIELLVSALEEVIF